MEKRELEKWDKEYLWHPFTQMADWVKNEILIIDKGKGIYLEDIAGNKYIDGVSSLWVNLHGHRRKEIDEAIKRQLDKIAHSTLLGLANVASIKLAKELVSILPRGLERVFYSDSGSTAVEIGLKMAYQYWQLTSPQSKKYKFLALKEAYHGDTIGSVSVGGIDLFHGIFRPLLFESYFSATPYCYRCEFGLESSTCDFECLKDMERTLERHHDEICAVIIEPLVQGAAGMIVQPKGFLKGVRGLCDKYNVLMIADEVAVGFGRTGSMFACEQEEVSPDIITLGKGISGGYLPLAATVTNKDIYEAFLGEIKDLKTFFHGHTYTGNPLACAAGLASLECFKKDDTITKLQSKIEFLKNLLEPFKELPHVGDIRQKGFMVGIELVKDKKTKESYPIEDRIGHKVILSARKKGVIIRPLGDVIVLMPPLVIEKEEIERLVKVVYESIIDVTKN